MLSMPFCTVRVICDNKSIFIPRDGDCTIETHVYDETVNFTIEIQTLRLKNMPFSSEFH